MNLYIILTLLLLQRRYMKILKIKIYYKSESIHETCNFTYIYIYIYACVCVLIEKWLSNLVYWIIEPPQLYFKSNVTTQNLLPNYFCIVRAELTQYTYIIPSMSIVYPLNASTDNSNLHSYLDVYELKFKKIPLGSLCLFSFFFMSPTFNTNVFNKLVTHEKN